MHKTFSFFLTVLLLVPSIAFAQIETRAKQAIVMDYETGTVLLSKNADEQMPTSSMSKVITMYAVFEALENKALSLTDTLPVSEKAWRMGGSKMFVEVDKRVKVEDLIRGVIIQSGNDATIVLAEGIAGTEEAFADILNAKAKSLGMNNSRFANASGWPDPNHYSTARDLATLGSAIIKDFPSLYKYYAEKEFTFNNIKQANRNPLLYRGIGADGIKTGHTEAAGYGLIGSGTENGRRVVMVINGLEDERARAEESAKLLEWGLKRFENKTLAKAGQVIGNAEVVMGKAPSVGLTVKKDLLLTLPKMAEANIKIQIKYNGPLIAPVKEGQEIGTLEITIPGMEPVTKPVFAAQTVEELGLFAKTLAKTKLFIRGR
ncbi:MAG: D-alanyl-D-alanine carboxypeptidase family protein [Alphaproteobacteria bacterium]